MRDTRVLITGPSLDVTRNVSGISSLVGDILRESSYPLTHFPLGSRDGEKKGFAWLLKQVGVYCRVLYAALFRRFTIVHLNVGLETPSIVRDSLVLFLVKGIFRKKALLHVHGGYFLMHPPENRLIAFLLRKLFRHADAVVVLSAKEKEILQHRYGPNDYHILPNAVNAPAAGDKSRRMKTEERQKIIFIGRINTTKGIYTISAAFGQLTDAFHRFSFEIYGAGAELEHWLGVLAGNEGLQYHYHGVVGGADKWAALAGADIFLLPSLHSEGLPIAMIEAMAMGCLVIATDDASIGTVVTHEQNGLLIPKNDPAQLAAQLRAVLHGQVDTGGIARQARQYVQEHLSISSYIKRLDDLYSLLSQPDQPALAADAYGSA